MRKVVVVESTEKYNKWLAAQTPTYDPATMGKSVAPPAEVKTAETKEVSEANKK